MIEQRGTDIAGSQGAGVAGPSVVAPDFARSELFERTFAEGMALVEDAAAYLDGAGRQDSKALGKDAALSYAGESMRLTTRLMQVASWLLVQRAVREGEMASDEAGHDRYRLSSDPRGAKGAAVDGDAGIGVDLADPLPAGLTTLMDRADRLYERVLHLDRRMYVEAAGEARPHPVLAQHDRLRAAFGG